ncbi:MAG: T9SS type A sorting domain-containing protein [Chitinophagales bacterium]|nr:T9SS type A sorting domain-containing protein [Chitinophagales bacterium]
MRKHIYTLILSCFLGGIQAQTYTLTVNNGYGSGTYAVGDTVHIWAKEFPANAVYDKWTGDIANLAMPAEWHTTLVMPASNVIVTANFKTFTPFTIAFDSIQGQVIKKPVYSYFPANYYGVIYFFHGTGGHASNWINSLEYRQMINQAVADSFAFIVTEADEATTGIDANGDGKLRWSTYPLDSVTNVDMANIKIITDTFINRGYMNRNTKRFSIGMSNGGAYSASCSYLFGFNAGISYCAQGLVPVFAASTVPFQFCMAKYDANDNVGPVGNANALSNANQLTSRNICSRYYLHDKSPVYPERFMRIAGVTLAKSQGVLNDLVSNGMVDANNNLILLPDTIVSRYLATPSLFPGFNALNLLQRSEIPSQIKATYADHQFYSDYNTLSLAFLKDPCDSSLHLPNAIQKVEQESKLSVFPNPVFSLLNIDISTADFTAEIYNSIGVLLLSVKDANSIDVSSFSSGIYIVRIQEAEKTSTVRFFKQ